MCGRYAIFDLAGFARRYGVEPPPADAFDPTYNAAPGQHLPVVTDDVPGTVTDAKWGFVPSWADGDGSGHVNARAETAHEKPSFRDAFEARRCVVPADGFYEWARTDRGKRPFRVTFDWDQPVGMAGVWATWTPETTQTGLGDFGAGGGGDGNGGNDDAGDPQPVRTFAVLTTEPNDVVADLHDRMAVVLDPDDAPDWLDGSLGRDRLLEPYPAERTRAYEVSTAVNDAANDYPGLVESVAEGV